MIQITKSAATRICELVAEEPSSKEGLGLRLYVEKGGCSGLQYCMKVDLPQPDDELIEMDGARVYLEVGSSAYLKNCKLDFEDSLTCTGFRIHNPNAKQTCGCGTSFEA